MATILLSIRPEYVEAILAGNKKYEFRKRLSQKSVEKIVIYATTPIKAIVGEVVVTGTIEMSPKKLWETTKTEAGISQKKFKQYFADCDKAYAYRLGKVTVYEDRKKLSDYGIFQAPQSYVYL